MKVLALVTEAFGGRGGIAAVARDVVQALSSAPGFTRIQILPRGVDDDVGGLPAGVVQARACHGRIAYSVQALLTALRERPQLIYCSHLYMAPLAALLARWVKARLVVHLHGVEIWTEPTASQRRALEAADLLLCVSRYTRGTALAFADIAPERAVVLNNTVSERFTPGDRIAARAKFGFGDEAVLLTVGRLASSERYKGHDRVIAALPEILKTRRDLAYVIAGEGDDRPRLERLAAEAGVAGRVRFIGHVSGDDLPDLYRAVDLFVMPSAGEGFGIVFLEALACGTPVLGLAEKGAYDALADGELGVLASLSEFPSRLMAELGAPRPTADDVSGSVRGRFGRDVFEGRTQALFTSVLSRA
jgi:phosphatidylinositol alpha-1,6-mannosyltransferase